MKKWLVLSVLSFFLSAMTIWFMPYESLKIILGGVFWAGFFMGLLFQLPISKARKADKKHAKKRRLAFSNKPAIFFDVLLILSSAAVYASLTTTGLPQLFSFGSMFALVFSLEMHGLFNGKNYQYLNLKTSSKRID